MKVGFTGTREGMTEYQEKQLIALLETLREKHGELDAAHGDCVGADHQFHHVVKIYSRWREIFPPESETYRAHCEQANHVHVPAPYLERNVEIARWCDILIAAPKSIYTKLTSRGTWHTVAQAEALGKPVFILKP